MKLFIIPVLFMLGFTTAEAAAAAMNHINRHNYPTKASDVYNKVSPSIYQLYAIDKNKGTIIGLGNSVAISKNFLATNCHIALAGNFLVVKADNNPYHARLCYFNQEKDLCIIDVIGIVLRAVNIRRTKSVVVGEDVYAVSRIGKSGELMTTHGTVQKIQTESGYSILQSNAQTTSGSSGGGLFDQNGNLIGLTTNGVPGTDTGYSISTELILDVVDPNKSPSCKLSPP